MLSFEIRSEIKFLIDLIFFFLIECVAGVRKGRGRKFGRETALLSRFSRSQNSLPVRFQTPATQATGGPEKVLSSLLLRRFVFRMAEASAKRVTGDEPQGTMGRVQTASRLPLRAHRERRLGTRQGA